MLFIVSICMPVKLVEYDFVCFPALSQKKNKESGTGATSTTMWIDCRDRVMCVMLELDKPHSSGLVVQWLACLSRDWEA